MQGAGAEGANAGADARPEQETPIRPADSKRGDGEEGGTGEPWPAAREGEEGGRGRGRRCRCTWLRRPGGKRRGSRGRGAARGTGEGRGGAHGGRCRARAMGSGAVGEDRRGGGRGGGVRRRRGLAAAVVSSLDPDPIGGEGERYFAGGCGGVSVGVWGDKGGGMGQPGGPGSLAGPNGQGGSFLSFCCFCFFFFYVFYFFSVLFCSSLYFSFVKYKNDP